MIELQRLNHSNKENLNILKEDSSISTFIHVSNNYVNYLLNEKHVHYYFILYHGNTIGGLHLETYDKFVTFSIEILQTFQRKGIASHIISLLKDNIFNLAQSKYKVTVEASNTASISLFKNVGFTFTGTEDGLLRFEYNIIKKTTTL